MKHRGQRRATNVTVRFFTRPAMSGIGCVTNVSPTGAFMETRIPLRLLSLVYLEPMDRALGEGGGGRIAATVVRHAGAGVGIEWCEFGAETTKAYALLAWGAEELAERHQLALPAMPEVQSLAERAHAGT
jgi:hypothetical protein